MTVKSMGLLNRMRSTRNVPVRTQWLKTRGNLVKKFAEKDKNKIKKELTIIPWDDNYAVNDSKVRDSRLNETGKKIKN